MKRLFITSYQKSGTHQVYPMFMPQVKHIVDRSHVAYKGMDAWGFTRSYPRPTWEDTAKELREMGDRTFGHVAYLPQYAEAVQAKPTKVLFNCRDPRDVIVAELEHIRTMEKKGTLYKAWLNYNRVDDGLRVIEREDPISELIRIDAIKWSNWIGWLDHDFVVTVKYEDLRLRTMETIQELRAKLEGCSLPPEKNMVRGTKPGKSTPSFRLGKVGEWRRYFKDGHVELADELLGPIITKLGYRMGR